MEFVPIERGAVPRDDRPRVRVSGSFAGEIPGIEFIESGVDVVDFEHDARRDPVVGVDLDDAEQLADELLGPWSRAPEADTAEERGAPRESR